MQLRVFGRTGMQLSVLGFGCGAVGGFMVRGDPTDQERTIARAIAAGVNYFDTAVQYGNGESEANLGRVLQNLKPAKVAVGTKVRLPPSEFGRIALAVTTSLEGSLARLRLVPGWIMAALSASPSEDCASMMQSRKHCLALSAQARSPLQPLLPGKPKNDRINRIPHSCRQLLGIAG
jgi:aryl-alcohol dehydrogenase-like predicted oxidoreductase